MVFMNYHECIETGRAQGLILPLQGVWDTSHSDGGLDIMETQVVAPTSFQDTHRYRYET